MSNRTTLPAVALLVILGAAACSGPASTGGPGSPLPTGTPADTATAGIAHPAGTDEIVLRYDEIGGFVPVEIVASHVPYFTLYGDGTVVYVSSVPVEWQPNQPMVGSPIRTGRLTEEQMGSLLEFALSEGGLAIAREQYDNPMVADAPTAVFEINAAGDSKTVSVVALGTDPEPGPDSAAKAALQGLAERLRNLDQGGTTGIQAYAPEAYRGVLLESPAAEGVVVREWPWPDLAPADFDPPADPNALQQRTRTMTPDEAAAIGVEGFENGIQGGLWYRGPDGLVYSFVLRPLLPDEQA